MEDPDLQAFGTFSKRYLGAGAVSKGEKILFQKGVKEKDRGQKAFEDDRVRYGSICEAGVILTFLAPEIALGGMLLEMPFHGIGGVARLRLHLIGDLGDLACDPLGCVDEAGRKSSRGPVTWVKWVFFFFFFEF